MNFTIDKIKYYLANDFENALFDASISYLENESDPLRFNSFAYSMREVYRHVLTRLAPDEKVIACTDWFDPAVNEGRPTRKYKFLL